jgi:hypothetical protein
MWQAVLNSVLIISTGSAIFVYGTIPQSNSSFLPPNATYQVDSFPPFATAQPTADHSFDNQPLFAASTLNNSQHQINITVNSAGTPYTLDFFFIQPHWPNFTVPSASGSIPDTAPTSPTPSTSAEKFSTTLLQILAVLLSIAVLTLAVVVIYLFYRRRRRLRRCGTSVSCRGPSSKERGMFFSFRKTITPMFCADIRSMFTTTDSILRDPDSMLWYDSQSRQSRASDWASVYPPLPVAFGYPLVRSDSSLDISPHKV